MKKLAVNILSTLTFAGLTAISTLCGASQSSIFAVQQFDPIEDASRRQVVQGNFVEPGEKGELMVYVGEKAEEGSSYDGFDHDIKWLIQHPDLHEWASQRGTIDSTDGDDRVSGIFKSYSQRLVVHYQNEEVFSSSSLPHRRGESIIFSENMRRYQSDELSPNDSLYDSLRLVRVCRGPDQRDSLLFKGAVDGSANGDINDFLFVYYAPHLQKFVFKIVERRYLSPLCNMDGAVANKQREDEKLRGIDIMFDALALEPHRDGFDRYRLSGEPLPTRQLPMSRLKVLLTDARMLVPEKIPTEDESERDNYGVEDSLFDLIFTIKDIAENNRWLIKELKYKQFRLNRGVLIAVDKNTWQPTVFYSTYGESYDESLSNVMVYGDYFIAESDFYGPGQPLVFSLKDFRVLDLDKQRESLTAK